MWFIFLLYYVIYTYALVLPVKYSETVYLKTRAGKMHHMGLCDRDKGGAGISKCLILICTLIALK